jgi:hypothetical protein
MVDYWSTYSPVVSWSTVRLAIIMACMGNWHHRSSHDPLSAHSRTGYVIMYAGCPILLGSRHQHLIALSTTEAEYIALSTALREVISVMALLNKLNSKGFIIHNFPPTIQKAASKLRRTTKRVRAPNISLSGSITSDLMSPLASSILSTNAVKSKLLISSLNLFLPPNLLLYANK